MPLTKLSLFSQTADLIKVFHSFPLIFLTVKLGPVSIFFHEVDDTKSFDGNNEDKFLPLISSTITSSAESESKFNSPKKINLFIKYGNLATSTQN